MEKIFTHKELVMIAYRWAMGSAGCGFALREPVTMGWETPDVIGFRSGMSVVIEVKTSRADFFADKKKPFRMNPFLGMGRFRFFMCPTDLIKVSELPDRWGLIYVNEKGQSRCVHNPFIVTGKQPCYWANGHESNESSERDVLYSALRKLNQKGLLEEFYK